MPHLARFALVALVAVATACSVPEGYTDPPPGASGDGPVATDVRVRTIQLYRGEDEVSVPVLSLRSDQQLTLEFDILEDRGARPLDIEFRRVERDNGSALLPSEYLTAFDRDNIFDADPSGATAVPYTHYTYRFPNASIGFRLGGEYRLR
ncbi:MAG: type IX secretion system plug protein domain-containing protein, partial [Bacteroidota bacterium]